MDEYWAGIVVVDNVTDGGVMRALYERAGDEPKRPVRRRVAAVLRWLAARLAPLPSAPHVAPQPATEQPALS